MSSVKSTETAKASLSEAPSMSMTLPATLKYREFAVHSLAAACHLVGNGESGGRDTSSLDLKRVFDSEFISAFSEIFNNIAIHAYGDDTDGKRCQIHLTITPGSDCMQVVMSDNGSTFELDTVPSPELESLPEGGMGIHIARACLDELEYTPGPPNIWRLTKHLTT